MKSGRFLRAFRVGSVKFVFSAIIMLSLLVSIGDEARRARPISLTSHPYRILENGVHCDLTPLIRFLKQPGNRVKGVRPMSPWKEVFVGVVQVTKDGLLASWVEGRNTILLKNYPDKAVTDGKTLLCLAFQTGETYSYIDVLGASRTVAVFDYGIPTNKPPTRRTVPDASDKPASKNEAE